LLKNVTINCYKIKVSAIAIYVQDLYSDYPPVNNLTIV
jgi:hypothetical protein